MFRVFLVEDEIVVRESIKKNVDWESYGFKLAGEAGDGEIAYAQIKEIRPDLVITDIKMPFMDGLELARLITQDLPDIKIVFLTGYGEFEYAREAIRLNAAEYLLKPVTEATLGQTLEKLYDVLQLEHKNKSLIEQYQQEMREMKEYDYERFMNTVISGKGKTNELLSTAQKLEVSLTASAYALLLFRAFENDGLTDRYSEKLLEFEQGAKTMAEQHGALLFPYRPDGTAILVKGGSETDAQAICRQLAEGLAGLATEKGVQHFIACGSAVTRLGDLRHAYHTANTAFSYRYLLEGSRIVFYEALETLETGTHAYPKFTEVDSVNIDKRMIDKLLRTGTQRDARYVVDEYFARVGHKHLNSWVLRQYLAMDIQLACLSYLDELGIDKGMLLKTENPASHLETIETTRDYLAELLEQTLELCERYRKGRYDKTILEAQTHIESHYHQGEISLNTVAKAVNMSPTHFSTIFKQEMGQTFIEYLTQVRMDIARELLRKTYEKTSEIAYRVGYKDPHYFSYLFKKINGVSPKEYRNNA